MKKLLLFWQIIIAIIFASCSDKNGANNEITIYGNVIDRTTGHPLYNVLIQEKNKVGGSTVTGDDGNYEFTLPLNGSSDGNYFLIASKENYSESEYELVMSKVDKNRRVKVDFQLQKEAITYTGTIMDAQNIPIQGAHVSAAYHTWRMSDYTYQAIGSTVVSRADGSYTLELPIPLYDVKDGKNIYWGQWSYKITARKEGYKDSYYYMDQNADDRGKDITLNFTMVSNQVTITGKVTDSNGSVLRDAYMVVCQFYNYNSSSYKEHHYVGTVMADSDGRYSMPLSMEYNSATDYFFNMKKDGYQTSTKRLELSTADGGKTYTLDFILTEE